jgi:hypothetical protein
VTPAGEEHQSTTPGPNRGGTDKIRFVAAPYRARTLRRLGPGIVLAIFVVLLMAVPKAPVTLRPTPVLSSLERSGQVSLARDCGYSSPLPSDPARSLWLFCDTAVYVTKTDRGGRSSWSLQRFIEGSTAAVSSPGSAGRAPGELSEVATPADPGGPATRAGGAAAPFLAQPAGLVMPGGSPCRLDGAYAASWVSGVARVPSAPDLLITFNNYCVLSGTGGFVHEGFGVAEYDPATGTLSDDMTVFAGPPLGSPVFSGRYLYLYGPACTGRRAGRCTGTVLEARVPASPAAWGNPLRYRWLAGGPAGTWTPDTGAAAGVIAGPGPSGVSVASFAAAGRGYILVEQTSIDGAFAVYGSASPAGHWKRVMSGRVPCRAAAGYANFCRAIIAHPELSTPAQLVLSYFNPAAAAHGHVMAAGFRW